MTAFSTMLVMLSANSKDIVLPPSAALAAFDIIFLRRAVRAAAAAAYKEIRLKTRPRHRRAPGVRFYGVWPSLLLSKTALKFLSKITHVIFYNTCCTR